MDSTIDITTLGILEQQTESRGKKKYIYIAKTSTLWVVNSRKSVLCVPYGFVLPSQSFFFYYLS